MLKEHTEFEITISSNSAIRPLGTLKPGTKGSVKRIINTASTGDLERQLLELGFFEGAYIELLHQGLFGEPIAVRIDKRLTVALRRSVANAILVVLLP